MNKNRALKVVNPVLLVLFLNQAITGFLHEAIPHETYEVLHGGGGVAMVVVVVVHLLLNWSWVVNVLLKRRKSTGEVDGQSG
jgi:uncharacterized membrane protein YraQ (UPF0718 family)